MKIPLILRLKKQTHKEVAKAQDIVVREIYNIFNKAVLHGGTAIWRCYNGNRFSEDIDAYIPKDIKKINILFENLEKEGFNIKKKKIIKNSLYSTLEFNRTIIRFEALFKKPIPKGSLREYETFDSNFITVYTLTPEELIKEKVNAYLKRLKVKDLYDIFLLLRFVKNQDEISNEIKKLIKEFKKPVDEKELMVLIIEGIIPTTGNMIEYIKRSP